MIKFSPHMMGGTLKKLYSVFLYPSQAVFLRAFFAFNF